MITQVITGADFFCNVDSEHPFASLRRVGGGKYRLVLFGETVPPMINDEYGKRMSREDFVDFETAVDFVEGIAYHVESDPNLMTPANVQLKAEIQAKDEEIAALKAVLDKSEE